ncbi:hypothetical protein PR048_025250 [Dryococelus australis]|uniref:Uncharacterized protein n=1 Tax=Dryococelus australis TaxID=614101 RepID=A0ABQ9GQY1_9NEOP|nr:hypothetical protein PR048_025250 [Dryococelus australis]
MNSLVELRQICESDVEVLAQYSIVPQNQSVFADFDPRSLQLVLFLVIMSDCQQYQNLWKVVELLLILSHGQATFEQGFSINKQVEVENLRKNSYIAQRLRCDFLGDIDGVNELHNLKISKMLRSCASNARHRYISYLEEQELVAKTAVKRKNYQGGKN